MACWISCCCCCRIIIFFTIVIHCVVFFCQGQENVGLTSPRSCNGRLITNITVIRNLLQSWNHSLTIAFQRSYLASYQWSIDLNNPIALSKLSVESVYYADVYKKIWQMVPCINCTAADCNSLEIRRINSFLNIGSAALPPGNSDEDAPVVAMLTTYSSAKVCVPDQSQCLPLDPDLTNIMATSRVFCKLQWAWQGWHNETGRRLRRLFPFYILQENKAASLNGFDNAKSMWAYSFTKDDPTFFDQIEQAWNDIKPLYQHLHAYVRRKLMAYYGSEKFPTSGHIPAHLLGNMWAQDWTSIYDLIVPYPKAASIDLTLLLQQYNYTVYDMVQKADEFYQSLGMKPMSPEFWLYSVFVKPPGIEMVCQPSSWDMFKQTDFRIKMCSQVDSYNFGTIHHEMGHIVYFEIYKDQPIEFRKAANPGIQETIGDVITLSALTTKHLKTLGFLPGNYTESKESHINSQMMMMLRKVAFLPFGLLIDKYRWSLFDQSIALSEMNSEYWKLRCKLQGVSPPVVRTEEDFDAGAKYHVAASENYMMYFYAFIAQFQFHEALCKKMGWTRNFHLCNIYNSTRAGSALKEILKVGSSKSYPQILYKLTGSRTLDATPMIDYFAPIFQWLQEQNKGFNLTWQDECERTPPDVKCNYTKLRF